MKTNFIITFVACLLILYPPFTDALVITSQDMPGSKVNNAQQPRMLATQSMVSFTGRIINLNLANDGGQEIVTAIMHTNSGDFLVYLAPTNYLNQQGVRLLIGDVLSITGSKDPFQGSNTVIAAEIIKNGRNIKLRGNKGVPLWGGGLVIPPPEVPIQGPIPVEPMPPAPIIPNPVAPTPVPIRTPLDQSETTHPLYKVY